MKKPHAPAGYQKRACLLAAAAALTAAACLLYIFLNRKAAPAASLTAELYQDGSLIREISLNEVAEPYTFTIYAQNGGFNTVEVRSGSIGIVSADCPDQICVRQGFIGSSLLPVTCLPNRLVIQIREAGPAAAQEPLPDGIAY